MASHSLTHLLRDPVASHALRLDDALRRHRLFFHAPFLLRVDLRAADRLRLDLAPANLVITLKGIIGENLFTVWQP